MELSTILSDLDPSTQQKTLDLVAQVGIHDAGRILGYDLSHYDNLRSAGRLLMYHHRQSAPATFLDYVSSMDKISPLVKNYARQHEEAINQAIETYREWEYDCDWFSANTEYKTYLLKPKYNALPTETISYANMRQAIQFYHADGLEAVLTCFQELSQKYYTHASPTIFNAGTKKPQMSSCFLVTINDTRESILYTGVGDCGMISASNGGLGIDVSRVRHSDIAQVGVSQGLVPMIYLYNAGVRYIDQGGLRRGAATIFLRLDHIDVFDFCKMVEKVGDSYERVHDINIALWVPDLFWERVRNNGNWTLFCPAKCKSTQSVYGSEFKRLYEEAERDPSIDPNFKRVIKARDLLSHVISIQRKTGMPYILHSDKVNRKSNQKNLGYIRSSNLCLEIMEFSSDDEIPSCNLGSLSVRRYVKHPFAGNYTEAYDFALLGQMTRSLTRNLNRVIDNNWCPLDKLNPDGTVKKAGKIRRSNERNRPIGLGVSGLADAVAELDLTFESPETYHYNKLIFACMYFNALLESIQLAVTEGKYETFDGSPFSEGKLQFDLWAEEFEELGANKMRKKEDDLPVDPSEWGQTAFTLTKDGEVIDTIQPTWNDLKRAMVRYGTRNSLLLCQMPNASTAMKMRNCESVEAYLTNIMSRKVMTGAYPVINRHMVADLEAIGLWNDSTLEFIKASNGSLAGLDTFIENNMDQYPEVNFADLKFITRVKYLQKKYKTMWELSQKIFLKMAADRGRYIDQSQSTNIYLADPTNEQLEALHLTTDMLGLKTGMYYLRQEPAMDPVKFTVDPSIMKYVSDKKVELSEVSTEKVKPQCLGCDQPSKE